MSQFTRLALCAIAVPSCMREVDVGRDSSCDLIGLSQSVRAVDRRIIGKGAGYPVDLSLGDREQLFRCSPSAQRQLGWSVAARVLAPVAMSESAVSGGELMLPRWRTWYAEDDFSRMFKKLYRDLGPVGRRERRSFSSADVEAVQDWNTNSSGELPGWTEERYRDYLAKLVSSEQAQGVAGAERNHYSPQALGHLLSSYAEMEGCLSGREDNCLDSFPRSAVVAKAAWRRAEFGIEVPVFDTSPSALAAQRARGEWQPDAMVADPPAEVMYTVRLPNDNRFRLTGLHIMTRELEHWVWVSLWWSPVPDEDLGRDRPDTIHGVWQNYKMCVVTSFTEESDDPSWCSNPYLERGAGNANTNCVGCHQHAGTTLLSGDILSDMHRFPRNGRIAVRETFPSDYVFAIRQGERLGQVVQEEMRYYDSFEADETATAHPD